MVSSYQNRRRIRIDDYSWKFNKEPNTKKRSRSEDMAICVRLWSPPTRGVKILKEEIRFDRALKKKPVPDYVVYRGVPYDDNNPHYQKPPNHADVSILSNPDNEELPSNFELLYKSDKTQIVVYKIHNIEN